MMLYRATKRSIGDNFFLMNLRDDYGSISFLADAQSIGMRHLNHQRLTGSAQWSIRRKVKFASSSPAIRRGA